jgi:hypothetical protein
MDTTIYTELVLQLLPHMVNVWVDAPSSQKNKGNITQVCILSQRYSFQAA